MTNGDQHDRKRYLDVAMIAVFDIAGPLVAYSLLRSADKLPKLSRRQLKPTPSAASKETIDDAHDGNDDGKREKLRGKSAPIKAELFKDFSRLS